MHKLITKTNSTTDHRSRRSLKYSALDPRLRIVVELILTFLTTGERRSDGGVIAWLMAEIALSFHCHSASFLYTHCCCGARLDSQAYRSLVRNLAVYCTGCYVHAVNEYLFNSSRVMRQSRVICVHRYRSFKTPPPLNGTEHTGGNSPAHRHGGGRASEERR